MYLSYFKFENDCVYSVMYEDIEEFPMISKSKWFIVVLFWNWGGRIPRNAAFKRSQECRLISQLFRNRRQL